MTTSLFGFINTEKFLCCLNNSEINEVATRYLDRYCGDIQKLYVKDYQGNLKKLFVTINLEGRFNFILNEKKSIIIWCPELKQNIILKKFRELSVRTTPEPSKINTPDLFPENSPKTPELSDTPEVQRRFPTPVPYQEPQKFISSERNEQQIFIERPMVEPLTTLIDSFGESVVIVFPLTLMVSYQIDSKKHNEFIKFNSLEELTTFKKMYKNFKITVTYLENIQTSSFLQFIQKMIDYNLTAIFTN
jgi:hypothetical protein